MEPISVSIAGRYGSIELYGDDTIETVRQRIALAVDSHPDRLYIEVATTLPGDYYSSNPKNWTDLFLRLARGDDIIRLEAMNSYLTSIRVGTGMSAREIAREEWDAHGDELAPLFRPDVETFSEWRILGVPLSMTLPIPPKDIQLQSAQIPIPRTQSLWETIHTYPVTEFRTTEITTDMSEIVRRVYFPLFKPDTPNNIESMRPAIEGAQKQFQTLLALDTPKHETSAVIKAKWYLPFITTRITAPRTRFEQMFYGLTMSEAIPHVAYFTAKGEIMRHKFYVEDPKDKKAWIDRTWLRNWVAITMPQRRTPTLLMYRGTSRISFDRIAITSKDITIDIRREKNSHADLKEVQASILEWIRTFDAVMAFVDPTDLNPSRLELADMSLVASYAKDIAEFDMRRFGCLRGIFSVQADVFRVLRAEHASDNIPPRVLQAYQLLMQEGAERTPDYLAEEMDIPIADATELFGTVRELSEDMDLERSVKMYPILKFTGKEVIVKFVTNADRMLGYADMLRHVLTSDSEAVNDVCPRRLEEVLPTMVVPQQTIQAEDEENLDYLADLGLELEEEEEQTGTNAAAAPAAPRSRKVKIVRKTMATYNYFNSRLQKYDPETFDKTIYPSKCDKPKQVVALTPEDKARVGPTYDYSTVPEEEKLNIDAPEGTLICPPYWCMRDEIPLREEQLTTGDDGELHCPVCDGKVRPNDSADPSEYTVIKRDTAAKYPDFMKTVSAINKKRIPCCYTQPRSTSEVLSKEDESYVLKEDATSLSSFRIAYLSKSLAERLQVTTHYDTTIKKGRLGSGESDIFRIGLGRPSETLPLLFADKTVVKPPREARENVVRCSFYRTWRMTTGGDVLASIDEAYENGTMTTLDELEYVTTFLKCEVILIDIQTNQVLCGFWSDVLGANSRTIAILGKDVLGQVTRKKSGRTFKTEYTIDLRKAPFGTTAWPTLLDLHKQACSTGVPTLDDATRELQRLGKTDYDAILDPFDRIQAVFVPGQAILPVLPSNTPVKEGVGTRKYVYTDIREDDLPTLASQQDFVRDSIHPGFRVTRPLHNVRDQIVEVELASGFRVPIRPEAAETSEPAQEVTQTILQEDEKTLVEGAPSEADKKFAELTTYQEEIYQFLMYTLSKDVQTEEYRQLRMSVMERRPTLLRDLEAWFRGQAYTDTTASPIHFINKVRTPCGQLTNKDTCNKSSLCGWHRNDCKIRVKPIVKKDEVLRRLAKTLRDNDKQRALILDERVSPFFSTILYLEMPNELITTTI